MQSFIESMNHGGLLNRFFLSVSRSFLRDALDIKEIATHCET